MRNQFFTQYEIIFITQIDCQYIAQIHLIRVADQSLNGI